jgi:HD-like signal output (HDOD) protein
MKTISTEDAALGMVLTGDVITSQGRFLLPSGTVIKEKHFRIFKMWGITEVTVKDPPEESSIKGDQKAGKEKREIDRDCTDFLHKIFHPLFTMELSFTDQLYNAAQERCGHYKKEFSRWKASLESLESYQVSETSSLDEKVLPIDVLIEEQSELASLPDVYFRIIEILEDPSSSAAHLAEAISKDPSISGRLLKLVNSSLYGGQRSGKEKNQIDSLVKAITLVGFDELSSLGLGIAVIRTFKEIPPLLIDMKDFWFHSAGCGVISRLLSFYYFKRAEERFFMGGLLHNVGRLILLNAYPRLMQTIFARSVREEVPVHHLEKEYFGYTNAEIGDTLLAKWQFPKTLRNMVKYQHDPLGGERVPDAEIIHIALVLSTAFRIGLGGEMLVFPPKEEIWEGLGISPSIFMPLVKQADRQVSEIKNVFF